MRTLVVAITRLLALGLVAAPLTAQGFGAGVAIHSGQVLVAERGGPTSTGAVHVFERSGDGWTVASAVRPMRAENGGSFGTWLDVSGDRMLVGSPGTAFVFEHDGSDWRETASLTTAGAPDGTMFATGGAIADDVALVAAGGFGRRGGGPAGAVFVFERGEDGWNEVAMLQPSSSAGGDRFGAAMLTNGEVAAIGAPGATVNNARSAGAVYFYSRGPDGTWSEMGELTTPNPTLGESFGSSLHVETTDARTRITVGAATAGGGAGAAYSFDLDGSD